MLEIYKANAILWLDDFLLAWTNVCSDGQPTVDVNGKPNICHDNEDCPTGYFCHFGEHNKDIMCCPGGRVITVRRNLNSI